MDHIEISEILSLENDHGNVLFLQASQNMSNVDVFGDMAEFPRVVFSIQDKKFTNIEIMYLKYTPTLMHYEVYSNGSLMQQFVDYEKAYIF